MPYCKNCGAEVQLNALFCRNCGKPTSHAKPAASQQQPAPRPTAPQPQSAPRPATPQPRPAPRPATPQPQPAPRPAAPQPQPAPRPAAPQPQPAPRPAAPQPQPAPRPAAPQPQPALRPATTQPQPAPRPAAPQPQPALRPATTQPQPAPRPAAFQPQPAPRPAAPQPQPAPRPATPQPQPVKKNKTLLIVLVSVLLLAGIGASLWFFVFSKKDEQKTEVSENTTAAAQQTATTAQPVSSEAEPAVNQISVAEPEPVVETPKPIEEPMKGTQETPSDADFNSWYIGKAQVKGMPRNVNILSSLSDVQGGWKALFFQDPKNKYGVKAYTLANVVIAGEGSDLTFTVKRHSTRFLNSNKKVDEEKELDDVFKAKWKNRKLNASGAGSLTITSFWEQDGKQYAMGTFDSPDGIPVSLGMVRP